MKHLVRDRREALEAHLTTHLAAQLQDHLEPVMWTRGAYSAPCSAPGVVVNQVAPVVVLALLLVALSDTDRTQIEISAQQDGGVDPAMDKIFQEHGASKSIEIEWLRTEPERRH